MLCIIIIIVIIIIIISSSSSSSSSNMGARGNVVVKSLCYKKESRGLETRRDE
jgi:hypothetical protein